MAENPRWREPVACCPTTSGAASPAAARRDDRRQPRQNDRRPSQTGRRSSSARQAAAGPIASSTKRPAGSPPALIERGTKPGDRIGIWSPNCAEWTMIQYATAQVGAILVNINPAYRTDELEYVLNQSSMCTVFAARSFKSLRLRVDARQRARALPRPQRRVVDRVGAVAADRRHRDRRRCAGAGAVRS